MCECTEDKVVEISPEKVLDHQLEEWKYLNAYINQIDTGYQQSFVMVISIFSVLAVLFSSNNELAFSKGIFIIPPGIVAVLAYVSYQFRITAILRGHLAALERSMNSKLKENVHMWNSALVETFMARNNVINNFMMIPMVLMVGILGAYCVLVSLNAFNDSPYKWIILFVYWTVIFVCAIIVLIPFFTNEKVRRETYDEAIVMEKYEEYLEELRMSKRKFRYAKPKKQKKN